MLMLFVILLLLTLVPLIYFGLIPTDFLRQCLRRTRPPPLSFSQPTEVFRDGPSVAGFRWVVTYSHSSFKFFAKSEPFVVRNSDFPWVLKLQHDYSSTWRRNLTAQLETSDSTKGSLYTRSIRGRICVINHSNPAASCVTDFKDCQWFEILPHHELIAMYGGFRDDNNCLTIEFIVQEGHPKESNYEFPSSFPLLSNVTPVHSTTPNNVDALAKDLGKLFLSGQHADFTVTIQDSTSGQTKMLRLHRAILAARCGVLDTTLQAGMLETQSGGMIIDELFETDETEGSENALESTANAYNAFFHYLYTGSLPNDFAQYLELAVIAGKYSIPELSALCETTLLSSVTPTNAVHMYAFADRYALSSVRSACMKVIQRHWDSCRGKLFALEKDQLVELCSQLHFHLPVVGSTLQSP
eukprot:TRINITY_DN32575_c0_g1_i1.p1 TRINITY_DN32575_c0_g1~~TRINITY_DN32575_c0_g1_i1.p1  ORF type:complete len:412 (+),score=48.54 TRINITY_DN32575_c0_g1_i1:39-1274(+)